jgi:hypothetical protein
MDPYCPPLTKEETTAAVGELVVPIGKISGIPYPKVLRTKIDKPILNQQIGLISFFFFKTPFIHIGEEGVETKVFGYFKLRGNHNDKETAEVASAGIIKEQDSTNKILLAPIGHWIPLTSSDEFIKEKVNVSTDKEDKTQRDDLKLKDVDKDRNNSIKELKKREEEIRKEQKRIDKQLRKRIKKLQKPDDGSKTTLKYYTGRRVTEMTLWEQKQIYLKKIQEIDEKINLVRTEAHLIDEQFPTYREMWLEKYNKKRREVGVKEDLKPNEKNIEEYKSWRPQ